MHFKSNTLKQLKVTTLNKYLENNNLKEFLKLKKNEKCNLISHQIALGHLKSNINWKKKMKRKLKTAQVMSQMNIWIVMTVIVKLMMKKVILSSTVLERIVVLHLKKVMMMMMMMMMAVILTVWIQTVTFATEDGNENDHDVSNLFTTTRSGRSTTTWRCSYFKCKYMNKQVCLSHCPSVIFAVIVYL